MFTILIILLILGIVGVVVGGLVYSKAKASRTATSRGAVRDRSTRSSYSSPSYRPVSTSIKPAGDFFEELDTSKPVVTPTPVKEKEKTKIAGACELCGADQEDDAKFCPNCGNKFE